jgi:hypothetical protein
MITIGRVTEGGHAIGIDHALARVLGNVGINTVRGREAVVRNIAFVIVIARTLDTRMLIIGKDSEIAPLFVRVLDTVVQCQLPTTKTRHHLPPNDGSYLTRPHDFCNK